MALARQSNARPSCDGPQFAAPELTVPAQRLRLNVGDSLLSAALYCHRKRGKGWLMARQELNQRNLPSDISTPPPPVSGPSFAAAGLVGAVIGSLGSLLLAPGIIGWWHEPSDKHAISCVGPVREALSSLVWAQVGSTITVAVAFMLAAATMRKKRRVRALSTTSGQ